jgi:hypothetical protein
MLNDLKSFRNKIDRYSSTLDFSASIAVINLSSLFSGREKRQFRLSCFQQESLPAPTASTSMLHIILNLFRTRWTLFGSICFRHKHNTTTNAFNFMKTGHTVEINSSINIKAFNGAGMIVIGILWIISKLSF